MRDNDHVEPIELGNAELETVSAGMFGLEKYKASMQALQQMATSLNQTIEGVSQGTVAALSRL